MTCQVIDGAKRFSHTEASPIPPPSERLAIMNDSTLLPLAVALLIGIPAFGSCIGIGIATAKFLESAARQPEMIPELQNKYFLGVGVTDGAFIIATGIGLWFATANPFQG